METAKEYFEDALQGKALPTQRTYRRWFERFMEHLEMTPEDFYVKLDSIDREVRAGTMDRRAADWLERRLSGYIRQLREEGFADGTIQHVNKAVSLFLKSNRLPRINSESVDKLKAKTYGQRMARVKDILEMLRRCERANNPFFARRNGSVVMALKDCGLRVSDLSPFKVEDYHKALKASPEPGFAVFDLITSRKTGALAAPHLGPEATEALDEYLGDRVTGPLFPRREPDGDGRYIIGDEGLSDEGFSMMIHRLAIKLEKVSAHSLRKFHETKLGAAGMSPQLVALLQGTDPGGRGSYVQNYYDGTLTREYVKAYDELRVFGAPDRDLEETREALKELQLRMKKLEQEKYLAEHSLDYTLARMDEAGVPVNPETAEADQVTEFMMGFSRLLSVDPEGAKKLLEEALRKARE